MRGWKWPHHAPEVCGWDTPAHRPGLPQALPVTTWVTLGDRGGVCEPQFPRPECAERGPQ